MLIEKSDIVYPNETHKMKLLSMDVIECMEMLDAFSLDGKYIDINKAENRMSIQEAQKIKGCYYSIFTYAFNKSRINLRTVKRKLKPIKGFIIGIYKNGTPAYRFKSMRLDESVRDGFIIEQFSIALIEKLTYHN